MNDNDKKLLANKKLFDAIKKGKEIARDGTKNKLDELNKEIKDLITKENASPNAKMDDGWTVLMEAANVGHHQIAKTLLKEGANPNMAKEYGWTALMEAAYRGNTKIVQLLLERVVNPNAALKANWTALDAAHLGWENAKTPKEAKPFKEIVGNLKKEMK